MYIDNSPLMDNDALGLTTVWDDKPFPGSHLERTGKRRFVRYISDGFDKNEGRLKRMPIEDLQKMMKSAAVQLCRYARSHHGIPTARYEEYFDLGISFQSTDMHEYYLIGSEREIWAENEINYIGIGMYEAWQGHTIGFSAGLTTYWKWWQYQGFPTKGTYYWLMYGYLNFFKYYYQLDPCDCKPRNGDGSWVDGYVYTLQPEESVSAEWHVYALDALGIVGRLKMAAINWAVTGLGRFMKRKAAGK